MESFNKYGHYLLLILYVGISIYFKNCKNLLIFAGIFLIAFNVVETVENAITISYIISICYGIYTNFHLLENFEENKLKKVLNVKQKQNNDIKTTEKYLENNINDKKTFNKIYNNISIDKDIQYIISEELLANFLEKINEQNENIIFKKTIDLNNLKPIMPDLKSDKINLLKEKPNLHILDIPIIISNDNFIIDGHYRWFIRKSLLGSENKYNNRFINVQVVDMDIKTFIDRIREFKIKNNNEIVKNFKLDKEKIDNLKMNISSIKDNLVNIETFYNELNNLSLV